MINLLPNENKINNKKVYYRKVFFLVAIYLFILITIGIVFLSSIYLSLETQERGLQRYVDILLKQAVAEETEIIYEELNDFNQQIAVFESNEEKVILIVNLISKIIDFASGKVYLSVIYYENDANVKNAKIVLSGESFTRSSFLKFKSDIEQSGLFKKVLSPVSNILAEKDIDFALTLEIL